MLFLLAEGGRSGMINVPVAHWKQKTATTQYVLRTPFILSWQPREKEGTFIQMFSNFKRGTRQGPLFSTISYNLFDIGTKFSYYKQNLPRKSMLKWAYRNFITSDEIYSMGAICESWHHAWLFTGGWLFSVLCFMRKIFPLLSFSIYPKGVLVSAAEERINPYINMFLITLSIIWLARKMVH